MNRYLRQLIAAAALLVIAPYSGSALAQAAAPKPASTHNIGSAKLIIDDLKKNQDFYEKMFGMKEVKHYDSAGVYDESIMAFASGTRLALFEPKAEKPIQKSQYPVAVICTPEFDALTKRIEDAKYPLTRLPVAQSGTQIAITRDPSGNAIEILARAGKDWEVAGSKLIVADRAKAEEFYGRIFGAQPAKRYQTKAYDEVLMPLGEGAFLGLFQPLSEQPLPKSQFPVVAIYTSEFDAVVKRVTDGGLGFRVVKSSSPTSRIIVAKDPAGNGVEIIAR